MLSYHSLKMDSNIDTFNAYCICADYTAKFRIYFCKITTQYKRKFIS